MLIFGPGFGVRGSGGRERALGACPGAGRSQRGGGAARGLTAAVAAGEAATLGLASLAATGPAAASVKDPGRGRRREARDGGPWRWWASLERPPSSVSGTERRAAEGGRVRGLWFQRARAPRGPWREAGVGKLRPEAGRRIQGHAAGQGLPGLPGAAWALPAPSGGLGAHGESETVWTAASKPQAGPASLGLAQGQGLFCSPSTGAAKSGSWGDVPRS